MFETLVRERVRIPRSTDTAGAAGVSNAARPETLAGELAYSCGDTSFAVLLVNPHPHMGGVLGNGLLVEVANLLACAGGVVLGFDYSGVGESDGSRIDVASSMNAFWESGQAPEDARLLEDTKRVLHWLRTTTALPLVLVGYSFGAYAVTGACDDDVRAAVLISPTVAHHDFANASSSDVPRLVVYSDDDFATPRAVTEVWIEALAEPKASRCFAGGEHFYRGQEAGVARTCLGFVREHVPTS